MPLRSEYNKAYYRANRDKRKEQIRKWQEANRERCLETGSKWRTANRERYLKSARKWWAASQGYDFSKAEALRESVLACEICGDNEKLVVDHNHKTGQLRGRLCNKCNVGVGHLKDSPFLLERAADYLRSKDKTVF